MKCDVWKGLGGNRETRSVRPRVSADRGKGSGETGRFPQLVCRRNREVPPVSDLQGSDVA
jgi:hypothetical protein